MVEALELSRFIKWKESNWFWQMRYSTRVHSKACCKQINRGFYLFSINYFSDRRRLALPSDVVRSLPLPDTHGTWLQVTLMANFKFGMCQKYFLRNSHARLLISFIDPRDPERLEIPVLFTKGHDLIINAIDGYGPTFADTKTTELLTGGRDGRIAFNVYQ